MHRKIIWSPSAENDFAEILEYLSIRWNNKLAGHFIDIVDDHLVLIANQPKLFPLINKELKIRKCILTKHIVLHYFKRGNRGDQDF